MLQSRRTPLGQRTAGRIETTMEVRTVEKKILREKDGRWCVLEVRLHDGCLSICGSYGAVVSHSTAKKQALQSWINFFEDSPEELVIMNRRFGRRFTSARGAAAFVLASDGEFHGLGVAYDKADRVYLTEGCGQIGYELRAWFPEVEPYSKWHLNDMRAECEHQEALGWSSPEFLGRVCPTCGYKLGSAWLKRELPSEVIAWFEGLQSDG